MNSACTFFPFYSSSLEPYTLRISSLFSMLGVPYSLISFCTSSEVITFSTSIDASLFLLPLVTASIYNVLRCADKSRHSVFSFAGYVGTLYHRGGISFFLHRRGRLRPITLDDSTFREAYDFRETEPILPATSTLIAHGHSLWYSFARKLFFNMDSRLCTFHVYLFISGCTIMISSSESYMHSG